MASFKFFSNYRVPDGYWKPRVLDQTPSKYYQPDGEKSIRQLLLDYSRGIMPSEYQHYYDDDVVGGDIDSDVIPEFSDPTDREDYQDIVNQQVTNSVNKAKDETNASEPSDSTTSAAAESGS